MTAPNLTQGANLTLKKGEIVTFAQKAIAAPSIVEIDKQPQSKQRNEQLLCRKSVCNPVIAQPKRLFSLA